VIRFLLENTYNPYSIPRNLSSLDFQLKISLSFPYKNLKYTKLLKQYMPLQNQKIVKEIEEIKARLISIEMTFIGSEESSKEDKKAVMEALKEYKKGKTVPY